MNIAQVPRRFVASHWGGTETVILETCRRLLTLGHRTEVLTTRMLATCDVETIAGVPVRRFGYFYPYLGLSSDERHKLDYTAGNAFSFGLLTALTRQPDLDLIHLHTAKRIGGIGRLVARRRGIPYVVSLHGGLLDVPPDEAARWTEPTARAMEWGKALGWCVGSRRVMDDAAAIICVSDAERALTAARYPSQRVVTLPNGVDVERFGDGDGARFRREHGVPSEARVVLCVGRLDPQKGQLALVEAMPAVLAAVPDAHLVLVGHVTNEPYAERIGARAAELALGGRMVVVPGIDARTQAIVDAYHAADVFALPSVHEPFGIVVLEAWAAGRPVVAAEVGGVGTYVRHGVNGLLVAPGDGPALAAGLVRLLTDRSEAAALAAAGSATARREYDWDAITERLVALYEEVCGARPVRS